jgi:hypothetical protein
MACEVDKGIAIDQGNDSGWTFIWGAIYFFKTKDEQG